ncbi:unnamed protein product [Mytilus edulis]|uniref:Uncharacterized protein n=1 Tax=Mytilus edulis TaxID=6550 RepID=A0A8S3V8B8_MYTED|nr:unnamed protein product [Mytilus edulis]
MHTPGQQDKPISEIKDTYMQTQEHKTTMTTRQLAIFEFMSKFGLDTVYPQKITLVDVMKIRTQSEEITLTQLPWMVLENLMMMNSTCRDKMLQEFLERISQEDDTDGTSKTCDDEEDNWAELSMFDTDTEDTKSNVNPLDLLVAIFLCSSQSLGMF